MALRLQNWLPVRFSWNCVLSGLSGILLILVLINIWFYSGNVDRQQEVNRQQAIIQQNQQYEALYRDMVKVLADLATSKGDDQLRTLLASQGITLNTEKSPAKSNQTER